MILALLATLAANPATLTAVLTAAKPGDTIRLAKADYPAIALPRKAWSPQRITIDASKARIAGIVAFKVSGVTITGGTITGPSLYAVSIRDSSRVSILHMDLSGVTKGIVLNNAVDVLIRDNKLHGIRTDGIDVIGQRVVIENNTITDMRPVGLDHPDGIQLWSVGTQTRDITIRGNKINGAMQGIFGRAPGIGLSHITVTGNDVLVDYGNGIVLVDTTDSLATGNSVKSTTLGQFDKANMRVVGDRNKACGNVVPDVPSADAGKPC